MCVRTRALTTESVSGYTVEGVCARWRKKDKRGRINWWDMRVHLHTVANHFVVVQVTVIHRIIGEFDGVIALEKRPYLFDDGLIVAGFRMQELAVIIPAEFVVVNDHGAGLDHVAGAR